MAAKTKLGLGILGAALILGLLGNALLRVTPWGLNAFLWLSALTAAVGVLARWGGRTAAADTRWLLPCILLFAGALAWRDSPVLKALDGLAILLLLSIAAFRTEIGRIHLARVTEYPLCALRTVAEAIGGSFVLVGSYVEWSEVPRDGWTTRAGAVGRGLLFAVPLLLLFGALFTSADAAFGSLVAEGFQFDVPDLVHSGVTIGLCAGISARYLRSVFLSEWKPMPAERREGFSVGAIELGTALGLLNLLFLAFVAVQVRYFFGGNDLVQTTENLTCSDYARRGFFELVTVAALMLPLLLTVHWLQDEETRRTPLFPLLAGGLVMMLFVIMASAVLRMRLYQAGYGLTELRLYTTAFMGWLALVFLWFIVTVLRNLRDRFAFGALVAGLLAIAALHVLNPDAYIVRANAARVKPGEELDVAYAASLSADAIPELVRVLPNLQPENRKRATIRLRMHPLARGAGDWRAWSWSRHQAAHAAANLPPATPLEPVLP